MARTPAHLGSGTRISDHVTLGVLTATVPGPLIDTVLGETGRQSAYSGERDQPFWLMVITCFGDRDHARRGGVGPWRTAASDASAGGYSLVVSGGTGQGR